MHLPFPWHCKGFRDQGLENRTGGVTRLLDCSITGLIQKDKGKEASETYVETQSISCICAYAGASFGTGNNFVLRFCSGNSGPASGRTDIEG